MLGLPTKWSFFLRREEDEIGIYLRLVEYKGKEKEVFARYDTTIKKADGTTFTKLCTETIDMKSVADWGWSNFGTITNLTSNKASILLDGTLNIHLRFTQYARQTFDSGKKEMDTVLLRNTARFKANDDFMNLLESGFNADFVIQMKDGKSFKVHKAILGARSQVFLRMFESQMLENESGVVLIDDMSGKTMEVLLKYIYSGSLEGNNSWTGIMDELIYASEKYELIHLKEFCEKTMIQVCTPENAMNLLKMSRIHGLDIAFKDISEYVKLNIRGVLQTI